MPKRVYVGPIDAVVTRLDGVEMTLARGEEVEVSVEQAKQLDEDQVNWAKAKPPAPSAKEGDK